jgi:hypothetical protein
VPIPEMPGRPTATPGAAFPLCRTGAGTRLTTGARSFWITPGEIRAQGFIKNRF